MCKGPLKLEFLYYIKLFTHYLTYDYISNNVRKKNKKSYYLWRD